MALKEWGCVAMSRPKDATADDKVLCPMTKAKTCLRGDGYRYDRYARDYNAWLFD